MSRRYLESSSFKMALLFTVLLTVSAAILGYLLMDLGKRDFLRETEAAIDIEISMLSSMKEVQYESIRSYIEQRASRDQQVRFRYEDHGGTLLGGTIDPMPSDINTLTEGVLVFHLDDGQGLQSFSAKVHTFSDGSRLIVARNVDELMRSHDRLNRLSWLIMLLMLAVVAVSFAISYFVVSRINRIAATARSIMQTGDLSQRLSIDSGWDDLSNLSQVLNDFLEKTESLMNGIREVSNNIAHDLRTPLSSLRNDIEALKGQPVDDGHIDTLLLEADRILSIFHALLRITNIEKGRRSQNPGPVNVGQVLRDVGDLYEALAEEKQIHCVMDIQSNLMIRGDSDLLFQLFANLLDNAVKFSPQGSTIHLYAGRGQKQVVVWIADQGPGVASEDIERVFRHFYRGDASRSTSGNGLGLSLVKAVVEHHQAVIQLEDADPGLRVRLAFQPYQ